MASKHRAAASSRSCARRSASSSTAALIQDMLTQGIPMPDDRTRHVVAELLNTIFDIDKMLYFVAPEWWRPRLHRSHQALGGMRKPRRRRSAPATAPALCTRRVRPVPISNRRCQASASRRSIGEDQRGHDRIRLRRGVVGRRGREPRRQLLHHRGIRARQARQLAGLAAAARRRQHAQRLPERAVGQGRDPDPPGQGARGDQLAAAARMSKAPTGSTTTTSRRPASWRRFRIPGRRVTVRDAINHLCDMVAPEARGRDARSASIPTDEINDDNRCRRRRSTRFTSTASIRCRAASAFMPERRGLRGVRSVGRESCPPTRSCRWRWPTTRRPGGSCDDQVRVGVGRPAAPMTARRVLRQR